MVHYLHECGVSGGTRSRLQRYGGLVELHKFVIHLCVYFVILFNVQLQIDLSTLKKIIRSVLHLLGYVF